MNIELTTAQARQWGLRNGDNITLQAGIQKLPVRVVVSEGEGGLMRLPEHALSKINWPNEESYKLLYSHENKTLKVGPLVGILVASAKGGGFRWGEQLRELGRYLQKLRISGIFFSKEQIDFDNKKVSGLIWRGSRWSHSQSPIPSVIYDRILSRRLEQQAEMAECKKKLAAIGGVTLFNPRYFDKWEIHQLLVKSDSFKELLPDTKLVSSLDDVWSMLKKHGMVYLKPVDGTKGYGIIRLMTNKQGGYILQARNFSSSKEQFHSRNLVNNRLEQLLKGSIYIVQQGLRLSLIKGSPFDIRLLVQKDGKARWVITKAFSRIAAPGKFASNLSQGGTAMGIRNSLKAASLPAGLRRNKIIRELQWLGKFIPPLLEQEMNCILGEMGLDLALDRRGRIWLLEVNSKPHKKLKTEQGSQLQVQRSLERPLLFAKHLDGF